MRHFFIKDSEIAQAEAGGLLEISGPDVNHIVNVLRKKPGDVLVFCPEDGSGREVRARIEAVSGETLRLEVLEVRENTTEPYVQVTLIQGIIKGERMDTAIQKSVELGVSRIRPVITEHTVVRLDAGDIEKKRVRWARIAEEAAKQCGRGAVPEVLAPMPLKQVITEPQQDEVRLIAYENERETSLKSELQALEGRNIREIRVLIGPEGGLSPEEAALAVENGFRSVTLGPRILRAETAGPAVLAAIHCFFED